MDGQDEDEEFEEVGDGEGEGEGEDMVVAAPSVSPSMASVYEPSSQMARTTTPRGGARGHVGSPDMRLVDNRASLVTSEGRRVNVDGRPDMRTKENRALVESSSESSQPRAQLSHAEARFAALRPKRRYPNFSESLSERLAVLQVRHLPYNSFMLFYSVHGHLYLYWFCV